MPHLPLSGSAALSDLLRYNANDGQKVLLYLKFKLPNILADEMQQRVNGKLRELGFPSLAAWIFTRNIPKLARWSRH